MASDLMQMIAATFWFAPGFHWRDDLLVDDPPPLLQRFAVRELQSSVAQPDYPSPADMPVVHDALFRLTSKADGRPHYILVSRPPKGWRWLAHGGRVWAEPILTTPHG